MQLSTLKRAQGWSGPRGLEANVDWSSGLDPNPRSSSDGLANENPAPQIGNMHTKNNTHEICVGLIMK